MAEESRNLFRQTLMLMESGMTTMEIRLENLYVSIIQVLNRYIPHTTYNNMHTVTKHLSSIIYDLLCYVK